jgi:hypothetical protein
MGVPVPHCPRLLQRGGQAPSRVLREGDPVHHHVGLPGCAHRLGGAELLERPDLAADQQSPEAVLEQASPHADEGLGVGDPHREGEDRRGAGMLHRERMRRGVGIAPDRLLAVLGAERQRLPGEERGEVGLEVGERGDGGA